MQFEDKLKHMVSLKDLGNGIFKAGVSLTRAVKVYSKAMTVFPYLEALEPEQKAEVEKVHLTCLSNIVVCKQKEGDLGEVIKQATVGLNMNPRHIKLLYLRGAAYAKQNQFPEAEADLKLAAEVDPNNKDVARELRNIKAKVRAIVEKEKKAFGGFFNKVKLVSEEEIRQAEEEAKRKKMQEDMEDDSDLDEELPATPQVPADVDMSKEEEANKEEDKTEDKAATEQPAADAAAPMADEAAPAATTAQA
jgi:tetratricopeptide (TPR) repeat protein